MMLRCEDEITESEEEQATDAVHNSETIEQAVQAKIEHHLSLNTMKEKSGVGTIRFQAQIQGVDI